MLQKLAPADPRTVMFRWALALTQRDFAQAERLVAAARRAELPGDALAAMEQRLAFERERAPWWQRLPSEQRLIAAGTGVLTLFVVSAAAVIARRRRLAAF